MQQIVHYTKLNMLFRRTQSKMVAHSFQLSCSPCVYDKKVFDICINGCIDPVHRVSHLLSLWNSHDPFGQSERF